MSFDPTHEEAGVDRRSIETGTDTSVSGPGFGYHLSMAESARSSHVSRRPPATVPNHRGGATLDEACLNKVRARGDHDPKEVP